VWSAACERSVVGERGSTYHVNTVRSFPLSASFEQLYFLFSSIWSFSVSVLFFSLFCFPPWWLSIIVWRGVLSRKSGSPLLWFCVRFLVYTRHVGVSAGLCLHNCKSDTRNNQRGKVRRQQTITTKQKKGTRAATIKGDECDSTIAFFPAENIGSYDYNYSSLCVFCFFERPGYDDSLQLLFFS